MIERVHQHLLSELERTTRADTVFVVSAVLFNILGLFITWSNVPTRTGDYRSGSMAIYMLMTVGIIVIGGTALKALQNGRGMCEKINASLTQIYKDAGVEKYMPEGATAMGVVVAGTTFLAVAIPLLQYFKL